MAADIKELEERAASSLRSRFTNDPAQLDEVFGLYAEYVALGQPFPIDIEEHSLWLILTFKRPHDDKIAGRLAPLLRQQGKPVPPEVAALGSELVLKSNEVIADTRRRRAANAKATAGLVDISAKLAFVFGLPKSASRLLVKVLAAMHPLPEFRSPASLPDTTGYAGLDAIAELRYEGLLGFEGGGIIHSHAGPSYPTRFTLARLGLGHAVTVRHPADHLAALFCHLLREHKDSRPLVLRGYLDSLDELPPGATADRHFYAAEKQQSHLFNHQVIFPTDAQYFLSGGSADAAISHLINDGYLLAMLTWVADWQLMRIRTTSALIRYEDFIDNPRQTSVKVASQVFGSVDDDAVQRGLDVFGRGDSGAKGVHDPAIYPRGYTSGKNIWRQYFSAENQRAYTRVCQQFVEAHPYAKFLTDLYPDLLLGQ